MAGNKVAGVDVLLSITDGGTDKVLGGQSGATLSRSTNVIEVTSKDSGGWASSVAGVKSWSVDCDGFVVMDDEALGLLETAWLNGDPVDIKIAYPNGKTYGGKGIISDFKEEYPGDDATTYSLSFTGTEALTITNPSS